MSASFKELISSQTPTLIDFYATWCGPCKTMAPILEELKGRMGEKVRIIKIDTERHQELAASLQIRSIPTLMLYRESKLLWRHSGTAGTLELEQIIEKHSDQTI